MHLTISMNLSNNVEWTKKMLYPPETLLRDAMVAEKIIKALARLAERPRDMAALMTGESGSVEEEIGDGQVAILSTENVLDALEDCASFLKEAHDENREQEDDDAHEDDCSYCEAVSRAHTILGIE